MTVPHDSTSILKDASQSILLAIRQAATFLVRQQHSDGYWEDYMLPVGISDAWVTGYVGYALAEASVVVPLRSTLYAALKAAMWLTTTRPYPAGWGFNGITGADADSTACAVRLIQAVGMTLHDSDIEFMLSRLIPGSGFSTFDGPGFWGIAHPDVTANVFLSLPDVHRNAIQQQIIDYLFTSRLQDGMWPSYWWRTCHYSTLLNSEVLTLLGMECAIQLPVVQDDETHAIHSDFDLACVAGVLGFYRVDQVSLRSIVDILISRQKKDGAWQGDDNLRVTHPECQAPWIQPQGQLYADLRGLITTATALRVLILATKGRNLNGIIDT